MKQYQLKLADGRNVEWEGNSPEDAIYRYLDDAKTRGEFPTVIAWRTWPRHGVFLADYGQMIEG